LLLKAIHTVMSGE
jgi:two-component system nitrate/nitrite response regulator NarL